MVNLANSVPLPDEVVILSFLNTLSHSQHLSLAHTVVLHLEG